MSRFLLVLVEEFPIRVARLTCFTLVLIFLLLHHRLRLLIFRFLFQMRLFMLYKLLIPQKRISTHFTHERSYVHVLQIVLINVLDRGSTILATMNAMFWMRFMVSKERRLLAIRFSTNETFISLFWFIWLCSRRRLLLWCIYSARFLIA